MSYCELLGFKNGGYEIIKEFRNAHGWTAFVWDRLFKAYIPKEFAYDNWLHEPSRLWKLHNSELLDDFERFVLRSTFDWALVKDSDIQEYIEALQMFIGKHLPGEQVCHIREIIGELDRVKGKYIAVGWYGMSVSENLWDKYVSDDPDDDEQVRYDVSTGEDHFFVERGDIIEGLE